MRLEFKEARARVTLLKVMKKALKIVLIVFAIAFAAAQFIRPNRMNPPIVDGETLEATTAVPDDVEAILTRSCIDCHSNKTAYPWYSNITPVSFFLVGHIEDGRRHLNFSVWNTYDKRKKLKKLDEIREQVDLVAMPLPSYLWLHRNAVLSESDAKILKDWTLRVTANSRLPASLKIDVNFVLQTEQGFGDFV